VISIICPTIAGREHWLERCEQSYLDTTSGDYEFVVLRNYPNCNTAWNVGIQTVEGDVIHLTADDIEAHPGWQEAGLAALAEEFLPCPRILNPDGTLQSCGDDVLETPDGTPSQVARIPLFKRDWVEHFHPFPEMQYMGDYWLTAKCDEAGIPTLVIRDYLFTHGYAMEGRLNTLAEDITKYHRELGR